MRVLLDFIGNEAQYITVIRIVMNFEYICKCLVNISLISGDVGISYLIGYSNLKNCRLFLVFK